jgi:hypothetical protein
MIPLPVNSQNSFLLSLLSLAAAPATAGRLLLEVLEEVLDLGLLDVLLDLAVLDGAAVDLDLFELLARGELRRHRQQRVAAEDEPLELDGEAGPRVKLCQLVAARRQARQPPQPSLDLD